FFQNILVADEYLYKDEVINNPYFKINVNKLGGELYQATGIKLKLVSIKEFKGYDNILDYEKDLIKKFQEPTILLIFSELNKKVDIYTNDISLYKYFDKEQVLSPAASPLQAFAIAITNSDSVDSFIANATNYGGTILPLIGLKAKKETLGKYSAALYNGYTDIAEQIAINKNVELPSAAGNANKHSISALKLIFYGFIIYAIIQYLRRVIYRRRHPNEFK
ncbi:MAG: 3-dehydroquinate dehydratase, partial [Sulfurimonas sp.]|nr:3-dehydroquinate dehydratase [Sulfurimonas sp.]